MKSKQYQTIEVLLRGAKALKLANLNLSRELARKRLQNSKRYKPPRSVQLIMKPQKLSIAKTTCYKLGSGKTCVLYLHGGSYVDPPNVFHWRFFQNLTREADVTIYVPLYGRAPQHHCSRTVLHMRKLYAELLEIYDSKDIVVMGDSAGGGLALALCENLVEKGFPIPKQAILFSPWLDVDMTGDYAELEKTDPILIVDELKFFGKCYRAQLPQGDYKASPLFGLSAKLPKLHVFVGGNEVFLYDCNKLKEMAQEVGAEVELYTVDDMPHAFVMYPIPEAKTAREKVIQLLADK